MKRILTFFIFFFPIAHAVWGQRDTPAYFISQAAPCGGADSLLARKGHWKKRPDANMRSDSHLKQATGRLEEIARIFQSAFPSPAGLEPGWYRTMHGTAAIKDILPYDFNSHYFAWYCNNHLQKIMLGTETGTWAYVFVNTFNWFMQECRSDGYPYKLYMLPQKIGEWKGYDLYEPLAHKGKGHTIIFTHGSVLPWRPISQLEYLKPLRENIIKTRSETLEAFLKQENLLQKSISDTRGNKFIKETDKEKMIAHYEKEIIEFRNTKNEKLLRLARPYDEKLVFIDEYLSYADKKILQQPAIVSARTIYDFNGKFATLAAGGSYLVTINAGYFNTNLPRSSPQFMVLYWTWMNDPSSLNFKKEFEDKFPVDRLASMIDK